MKEQGLKEGCEQNADYSMREFGPLVFLASLLVYLLTLNGLWAIDHATAFLEFDYAIWTNHTFVLGTAPSFVPHSVDIFLRNGSYYMAAAPGAGILVLPFSILGFLTNGGQFTVFGWTMVFSEIPIALSNAIAVYLVYRVARLYFDAQICALLAIAYAFSTISFPFATFVFQHDPSAMFDILAAYIVLRMARGDWWGIRHATVCGLVLSAAFLTDYVNGVLGLVILAYLLAVALRRVPRRFRKDLVIVGSFVLSFVAVGAVLYLAYNYVNFGNPLISSEEAYKNTSSVLSSFSYPIQLGVVLNTITPERGIFLFSPFLAIGLVGMAMMVRRLPREGLLMLALFLGVFIPYSMWRDASGGWGFGPRFLIPTMPFLIIPAGFALQKMRSDRTRILVFILYAAGAAINTLAAFTSAVAPDKGWLVSPFLDSTLSLLRQGLISSWWDQWWSLGTTGVLLVGSLDAVAIILVAFAFPAWLTWRIGRTEQRERR